MEEDDTDGYLAGSDDSEDEDVARPLKRLRTKLHFPVHAPSSPSSRGLGSTAYFNRPDSRTLSPPALTVSKVGAW